MRIKTKLWLGIGTMFLLIVIMTAISVFYINRLSGDTKNILADNYKSVEYAKGMLLALENDMQSTALINDFENNLAKQEKNVTEIGEQKATDKLISDYHTAKKNNFEQESFTTLRKDLVNVMQLNMEAIQRKSEVANATAKYALAWIMIGGTLCFVLAFTLLINLPGTIANPIRRLTDSMRGVAARNYSQRVHFEQSDEFGEMAQAFNTMAEKLQEYNNSNLASLMKEKKRIETLVNNMHEPVIGVDENKHILFMNDEALKISNTKIEDVVGKPVQDVAVNNDLIRMLVKDLFGVGQSSITPIKIYADDKESYFQKEIIRIRVTPTGETQEQHLGDVIFLKNVTSFKELDSAKTNFIATISHELKTPISSVKMGVQLLENQQVGSLNAEQKQLVEGIKDDANRLLSITGELLNMTQLESGNIQLSLLANDPKQILQYAINATKVQAEQKLVHFEITYPEDMPNVFADSEKTAWVLTNLISNAIRYSHENSVIYLKIENKEERVNFIVKDTGQGIAPQYQGKIFDRYFKIPGTQKEGTGLGLSISKEFIEAQNGSISIESELGAGSTFTVSLNAVAKS